LLGGDLGAGKTCFARGFVRARSGYFDMRVTSPTYLLSNTYPADNGKMSIHHMDLYRLSGRSKEELAPLNLDNVLKNCISLIEWPSRLASYPDSRLEILFKIEEMEEEEVQTDDEFATRVLILKGFGERWSTKLNKIENGGYLDDMIIEYDNGDEEEV